MSLLTPGLPMLGPLLRTWLTQRVTLEEPVGGDWVTEATGVEARIVAQRESVPDFRQGGLLQVQATMLYVLKGQDIDVNWRVTDEATGRQWITGAPMSNPEAPAIAVPLRGTL